MERRGVKDGALPSSLSSFAGAKTSCFHPRCLRPISNQRCRLGFGIAIDSGLCVCAVCVRPRPRPARSKAEIPPCTCHRPTSCADHGVTTPIGCPCCPALSRACLSLVLSRARATGDPSVTPNGLHSGAAREAASHTQIVCTWHVFQQGVRLCVDCHLGTVYRALAGDCVIS